MGTDLYMVGDQGRPADSSRLGVGQNVPYPSPLITAGSTLCLLGLVPTKELEHVQGDHSVVKLHHGKLLTECRSTLLYLHWQGMAEGYDWDLKYYSAHL